MTQFQDPGSPCCRRADSVAERRGFLAAAVAVGVGGLAYLSPLAVGTVAFLTPLREKSKTGDFLRLASLENLPEDGTPQKIVIVADRTDAWNRFPDEPIGAVYLRRMPSSEVLALQVICPHAGCFIGYDAAKKEFLCPCHQAHFDPSGKRKDEVSPAPRDLDNLEVEVRNGNEVWVKFQSFRTGNPQKIVEA